MHTNKAPNAPVNIVPNSPNLSESQGIAQSQAFQGVKSNLAPPSISKGPTQAEWVQMKLALSKINDMMARFL